MQQKSPEAFRTIGEVAAWLGVPPHVLRFWESKFAQVRPVKRAGGRRYYRRGDMALLGGIKVLLHDRGMTIKGVQRILSEDGPRAVTAHAPELDADLALAPDEEDAFDEEAAFGDEEADLAEEDGAARPDRETAALDASGRGTAFERSDEDGAPAPPVAVAPNGAGAAQPGAWPEVRAGARPAPLGAVAEADAVKDDSEPEPPEAEPAEAEPRSGLDPEPQEPARAVAEAARLQPRLAWDEEAMGRREAPRARDLFEDAPRPASKPDREATAASSGVGGGCASGAPADADPLSRSDAPEAAPEAPPPIREAFSPDAGAAPASALPPPVTSDAGDEGGAEAEPSRDAPNAASDERLDAGGGATSGDARPRPPADEDARDAPMGADPEGPQAPADAPTTGPVGQSGPSDAPSSEAGATSDAPTGLADPARAMGAVPACQEDSGPLRRRPVARPSAVRSNHDAVLALVRRLEAVRDRMAR